MLKKTSILVLFLLISLSLASCQKITQIIFIERADAFENQSENTYPQISSQITRFKSLINDVLDLNLESYSLPEMPFVRSDSEIQSPPKYFNETFPNELNGTYAIMSIIHNYYTMTSSFSEEDLFEFAWGDSLVTAKLQMNEDQLSITSYISDPSGVVISQYNYLSIIDGKLYAESASVSYDGTDYFDHVDSVYWEDKFFCSTYFYSFEGEFSGISQTYQDFSDDSFVYRRIDHSSVDETRYYVTRYDAETEHYYSTYVVGEVASYYISKQYSGNDLVYYTYEEDQFIVFFNLKYVEGWDTIIQNDSGLWLYNDNLFLNMPGTLRVHSDSTYGLTLKNYVPETYRDISFNLQNTSLTPPITYAQYLDQKTSHLNEAELYYLAFRDNFYIPMKKDSRIVFEHLDTSIIEQLLAD